MISGGRTAVTGGQRLQTTSGVSSGSTVTGSQRVGGAHRSSGAGTRTSGVQQTTRTHQDGGAQIVSGGHRATSGVSTGHTVSSGISTGHRATGLHTIGGVSGVHQLARGGQVGGAQRVSGAHRTTSGVSSGHRLSGAQQVSSGGHPVAGGSFVTGRHQSSGAHGSSTGSHLTGGRRVSGGSLVSGRHQSSGAHGVSTGSIHSGGRRFHQHGVGAHQPFSIGVGGQRLYDYSTASGFSSPGSFYYSREPEYVHTQRYFTSDAPTTYYTHHETTPAHYSYSTGNPAGSGYQTTNEYRTVSSGGSQLFPGYSSVSLPGGVRYSTGHSFEVDSFEVDNYPLFKREANDEANEEAIVEDEE